jgi:hypothetical protein
MSTWISFYVNTADKKALVNSLRLESGATDIREGVASTSIDDVYPTNSSPSVFLLGATQDAWITVFHNSFDKLEALATAISASLGARIIVTMAQSVSNYYYFALYERGRKLREIEACYSDDSELVNFGAPFPFEGAEPGKRVSFNGLESYLFDFNSIEEYGRHFGLELAPGNSSVRWTMLQPASGRAAAQRTASGKPWWKFW